MDNIKTEKGSDKKGIKETIKKINPFFYVVIALIIVLGIVYFYFVNFYSEHFYSKTSVNGFSISKMTADEAENQLNNQVENYTLEITGRNQVKDSISGTEIDLHNVFDKSTSELLEEQNPYIWPLNAFKEHELETGIHLDYDEDKLEGKVENLEFLKEENNIMPVNAYILDFNENGYEISPESNGSFVREEDLYSVVSKSIEDFTEVVNLEEEDIYADAEITSEYQPLVDACNNANKMVSSEIIYNFGGSTEILDKDRISNWLSIDEEYNVVLNEASVKEYVDYLSSTYDTFGRSRQFKTSYGSVITVGSGDYGWWMNRSQETFELTELIKNGEKLERTPVYYQKARQYGYDDIGSTYVEVNLSNQHLYFYKNGSLILESDFVSGNVEANWSTPTGTYSVKYKDYDAVLVGEDYETPVDYWMPFNQGVGFHDAAWRDEFGGNIYIKNGSHGCINMPPANAEIMFNNIESGVPVIVYGAPIYTNDEEETDEEETEGDETENTEVIEETEVPEVIEEPEPPEVVEVPEATEEIEAPEVIEEPEVPDVIDETEVPEVIEETETQQELEVDTGEPTD